MENAFFLDVRRKKELLTAIIDRVQDKAKISFEGKLKHVNLKILHSSYETSILKRNSSISNDFWVFDINEETKEYLKKELLNMIGLSYKVYHIFVEEGSSILFESVDNFSEDCVVLHEKGWVDERFVESLKAENIIWGYKRKGIL